MMGFELPYGFWFKRSRRVIDIIHTAVCRISKMVNPTIQHWSVFATVFAMMAHFVVYTVSLWQGKVVSTSAGASRSVSKELLLGKMRCLEESMRHVARRLLRYTLWLHYRTISFRLQSAIITYESLSVSNGVRIFGTKTLTRLTWEWSTRPNILMQFDMLEFSDEWCRSSKWSTE